MYDASGFRRWLSAPSVPGALVLVLSVLYVRFSYGPLVTDVSEVVVPMAISVALIGFGVRLRTRDYATERVERIVAWSWRGLLVGAFVGGWWVVARLTVNLSVAGVSDQILAVMSFGCGAGVVVGQYRSTRPAGNAGRTENSDRAQSNVVSETVWTGRAGEEPITVAVSEALADLESVEPHRTDFSLYEYVDPDAFESLANHGDATWQLRFHVEEYEVRVSGYGTVTVLERDATTTAS